MPCQPQQHGQAVYGLSAAALLSPVDQLEWFRIDADYCVPLPRRRQAILADPERKSAPPGRVSTSGPIVRSTDSKDGSAISYADNPDSLPEKLKERDQAASVSLPSLTTAGIGRMPNPFAYCRQLAGAGFVEDQTGCCSPTASTSLLVAETECFSAPPADGRRLQAGVALADCQVIYT